MVFSAVASLLLISCLNLANLLGARAFTRTREFVVRLALGAPRSRLALQAVAEILPVLLLGGTSGVVLAAWSVAAFVPLAPATLPRVDRVRVDGPVLAFSLITIALTANSRSLGELNRSNGALRRKIPMRT